MNFDFMNFDFSVRDEDSGVLYAPWTDNGAVGFRCEAPDGRVEYIYLNPSGGSDDGVPTVFLYRGPAGDPSDDQPDLYYVPFDEKE